MGKTSIQVSCLDQRLIITSAPLIASGGRNEIEVLFSFCPLWEGFQKVASFWRDDGHVYSVLIEGDRCVIPWEVLTDEGVFYFAVYGVKDDITRTSHTVKYKIVQGAIFAEVSDPTPEIYEQILSACQAVLAGLDDRFEAVDKRVEEVANVVNENMDSTHDASHITRGVFPIERGGTGADNAEDARANLGITLETLGAAPAGHTHNMGDMMDGQVPIEKGGTGADTAEGAREALGAVSKTGDTLTGEYKIVVPEFEDDGEGVIALERTFAESGTYRATITVSEDGALDINWNSPNDDRAGISIHKTRIWLTPALDVENGGTGARTAPEALANLGIIVSETEPENPTEGMIWIKVEPTEGA